MPNLPPLPRPRPRPCPRRPSHPCLTPPTPSPHISPPMAKTPYATVPGRVPPPTSSRCHPPPAVRRSPQEVVSHLNAILASEGYLATLSAARWTVKNNLVVTCWTRHDGAPSHLRLPPHLRIPRDSSSPPTTLPLPVQTRDNCKWARLLVNGIPTGASPTRGPYSPSELHAALLADNPAYRGLRLTQPPSWVRAPTSYTPGSVSSLVLTFEDPLGDSLHSLLAGRTLFAFGHSGELKRWKAKPRNTGRAGPAASSPPSFDVLAPERDP
ncbi:hypothetical protein EDB84DRAFT_1446652 [Lactarius hengduanensis]|nr:hypothetical protein EDB84DRAFT_1446652 [Lactarius hengduanensis]